jgi:hypothetical protein
MIFGPAWPLNSLPVLCGCQRVIEVFAMKMTQKFIAAIVGLTLCFFARGALAQNAVSPGQVRSEVRGLINDLNDPNYDYSKVPERMREVFQDFRSATDGMDPDQAQQFRQELFQQLMPTLQANQQKIQDAMRLAFLKGLQQPLGCSDDEFAAIKPYLEKVVDAVNNSQVRSFRGFGPGGGRGPGGGPMAAASPQANQQLTPVQKAINELQATLNDPNSSSDLIHNKLDEVRQARDKAKQDLAVAQSQLQALLTQRQEAVLVEYGLLE